MPDSASKGRVGKVPSPLANIQPPSPKNAVLGIRIQPQRKNSTALPKGLLGLMEGRRHLRLDRRVDDPVRLDNWQDRGTWYGTVHH